MGESKVTTITDRKEKEHFLKHLIDDINILEQMSDMNLFEQGVHRMGVEQEICLVDKHWLPAPISMEILDKINDAHFTTELARFNIELNLDPIDLKPGCFHLLKTNLQYYLKKAEEAAKELNTRILLTGILPTIKLTDLSLDNLTPLKRYEALSESMKQRRADGFDFRITGTDELITHFDTVMFESCNTSYQIHYQTSAEDFPYLYNWSQAIAGPVLSSSTNSPLLLGKRLWRETRIALFEQSLDIRPDLDPARYKSARVTFGDQWMQHSVTDAYKENAIRHEPLLSKTILTDSNKMLKDGEIPSLDALRIHNGTIYRWNRPCYGILNGKPHLRIENRYLAAGPTILDEVANTVFWIGLMAGMPKSYRKLHTMMDFDDAKTNFSKAARTGLDTNFKWLDGKKYVASDLLRKELIPMAEEGHKLLGLPTKETDYYFEVIKSRIETGRTGAQWIIDTFNAVKKKEGKEQAIVSTTAGIYKRQRNNLPVHKWLPAKLKEAGKVRNYYKTIGQIMTTDIYTVKEDDVIELVANMMDWRKIRHVPVESSDGHLVGLVTSAILIHYLCQHKSKGSGEQQIEFIMQKDPICVDEATEIADGLELMKKNKASCLLVTNGPRLVGLVTERDFLKALRNMLSNSD